ncbi:alkaline phosphatase-like protein [Saccharata proteae CBS 121410]|uniref:GPI ethanolamine phosphate transferase 2 n=1 Tax=Saccharata proteae CBS 121410 TaxID=1314787 RepID=A0A9P4LWG0_9PEZI|nr:alkaline phosphatase-like protein [Saccharata proteae CBS 121410]
MSSTPRLALLALANFLIPVAVLTFAVGFFPYKPFLPGLAEYEPLEYASPPEAPFDKVIFMVVDALRSLIRSGNALPFTAHATSPTITMPRVKAMTTGSIPSFLDVILNFAESDTTSTLAYQDTWLAQLKAKEDGKLVMYGDDTWLKLFPDTFSRSDGTSSFFVSDFTEVDNNVTRHVPDELRASDWNAMIMHYLGLDHIGHKAGPLSPNMIPKQIEMDAIVQQIYEAIESQPHLSSTLLVLCGDHGMNDGGNHGGSAPGETSPALVFMSPKMKAVSNGLPSPTTAKQELDYYEKIEQSDIAPTLAGLLGFPVPLNNLGVFIPDFLPFWPDGNDRVQLLLRNALQILTIVKATFPNHAFTNPFANLSCESPASSGDVLACKWRRVSDIFQAAGSFHPHPDHVLPALIDFCKEAQEIMSSTASNYNVNLLAAGIAISALSAVLTLLALRPLVRSITGPGVFFAGSMLLYGVMMFASSYVEEEQHFWYWTSSAWFAYIVTTSVRTSPSRRLISLSLSLLVCHRITRRWNQTGQKHAGAPDIVHSAFLTEPVVLWTLVSSTYLYLMTRLYAHLGHALPRILPQKLRGNGKGAGNRYPQQLDTLAMFAAALLCAVAFIFKIAFTARDAPELVRGASPEAMKFLEHVSLVRLARVVFLGCAGFDVVHLVCFGFDADLIPSSSAATLAEKIQDILTLVLITQTRASNIPLFLLFIFQHHILSSLPAARTQTTITTTTLLLAQTSFFAVGNSNAISSIDLSNAYNGVSGYNIVAVGVLLFLSNWAGPIWWTGAGVVELVKCAESTTAGVATTPFTTHILLTTLFTTFSLLATMVACTLLRTHLFIWTVFSPKYLYAMAWGVGFHLCMVLALGVRVRFWVKRSGEEKKVKEGG